MDFLCEILYKRLVGFVEIFLYSVNCGLFFTESGIICIRDFGYVTVLSCSLK